MGDVKTGLSGGLCPHFSVQHASTNQASSILGTQRGELTAAGSLGLSVGFVVSHHIPSNALGDQWILLHPETEESNSRRAASPHWAYSREEAPEVSGVGPAADGKATCVCLLNS